MRHERLDVTDDVIDVGFERHLMIRGGGELVINPRVAIVHERTTIRKKSNLEEMDWEISPVTNGKDDACV